MDSLEVKVRFDLMPKWPLCTLSKYMNATDHYNAVVHKPSDKVQNRKSGFEA